MLWINPHLDANELSIIGAYGVQGVSANTVPVTTTVDLPGGTTCVVFIGNAADRSVNSVADSGANTYVERVDERHADNSSAVYDCLNPGTTLDIGSTITATLSGSASRRAIAAVKLGRLATFLSSASSSGGSGDPKTVTTASVAAGTIVIVGLTKNDTGTFAAPAGWTTLVTSGESAAMDDQGFYLFYKVTDDTGTVTFTTAISGNDWALVASCYG